MASSSSTSSIQKSFKYDVFLSFRGEDTRKNFIDHLYDALTRKGINTYKDDESINRGKKIRDEIIRSIEDSKFYVIVFSKNYASSSWCLEELVKIMECQKMEEHTAYPVFFDIEPTEIRKQTGSIKRAFAKHRNEKDAGKWRDALIEAADLAGWELKNVANGHEAKFIQKIVEKISLDLRCIDLSNDGKLVGMEARVKDVVSSLEVDVDDVRMIGVKGMGGAGKTTLARAIFDQLSIQFKGSSFVENVREVSNGSTNGLVMLQKQVLSDVLNDQRISVSGVSDGKNKIKKMIRGTKVLIVLDDVNHVDQLEALAGEPNWFKAGSRIIITTRDEQVLVAHRVHFITDVNLLSHEEAICLFNRYAFGKDTPVHRYTELCKKVVHYADGLPLTVKVLGSFLCGKSDDVWTDAIERLKTIPLKETMEKLELSYSSLEDDYKEIFLDVACILKGWEKERAIRALESSGFHAKTGLKVLEQKSLLTISMNGCLGMHDHIEEMGKNIVRRLHPNEPHKHSRLWIEDEIKHILACNLGTEATRCITFQAWNSNLDAATIIKGLVNMKELRFLEVRWNYPKNLNFENRDLCEGSYLPDALRFLSWYGYPFTCLPINFGVNNLVGLEMINSSVVQLWKPEETKVLKKLRFIDLSNSSLRILDLRLIPNVETLLLQWCFNLVELDMYFGFQKLRFINLRDSKLRVLHLGPTPNLEVFDLNSRNYLVKLQMYSETSNPVLELPDISYLEEIHMGGDHPSLKSLVLFLPGLRVLELGRTPMLKSLAISLPGSILRTLDLRRTSPNLETLWVKSFYNLEELGSFMISISSFRCLRELKLEGSFPELPVDLHRLECLKVLVLSFTRIQRLPNSICLLKHLKVLRVEACHLLEQLPEDLGRLESLEKLIVSCKKIKHIPNSICSLKHLNVLSLKYCGILEQLPEDLGRLECLEELLLAYTKIKHLPNSICMLKHLKVLNLNSCWYLEQLPEFLGRLECLEQLDLLECKRLQDLPKSICKMKHLKVLNLGGCILIEKLPEELGHVECLEQLYIRGTGISYLPHNISRLDGLRIYGWP